LDLMSGVANSSDYCTWQAGMSVAEHPNRVTTDN